MYFLSMGFVTQQHISREISGFQQGVGEISMHLFPFSDGTSDPTCVSPQIYTSRGLSNVWPVLRRNMNSPMTREAISEVILFSAWLEWGVLYTAARTK
jgi:hypothetical protein